MRWRCEIVGCGWNYNPEYSDRCPNGHERLVTPNQPQPDDDSQRVGDWEQRIRELENRAYVASEDKLEICRRIAALEKAQAAAAPALQVGGGGPLIRDRIASLTDENAHLRAVMSEVAADLESGDYDRRDCYLKLLVATNGAAMKVRP